MLLVYHHQDDYLVARKDDYRIDSVMHTELRGRCLVEASRSGEVVAVTFLRVSDGLDLNHCPPEFSVFPSLRALSLVMAAEAVWWEPSASRQPVDLRR